MTVLLAVVSDLAERYDGLAVELGVGILGNEACVSCNLVNAKLLCKVRTCLEVENSLEASEGRNDTKRQRTVERVPGSLAAPTAPNGGDANAVLLERCKNLFCPLVGVAIHIPTSQLNGIKAHILNFFNFCIDISILMKINQQSKSHSSISLLINS